jgi:class 3 adenylate cyclase
MECIFGIMANVCSDRLVAHLGNTMGDGFILVGRHGHGADHIRRDALRVLQLARTVKTKSEEILAAARQRITERLRDNGVPRSLPDLKVKVTLHHGFVVTMMQSQRFFGDTVNYCARIASAAFDKWHEGIVLTEGFLWILPDAIRQDVELLKVGVEIRYPSHDRSPANAYRIALSNAALWTRVDELAGSAAQP